MKNFIRGPFVYVNNPKIKSFGEKEGMDIDYEKFERLVAKGLIGNHHFDILKLLRKHRHLTTHTIDTFLKNNGNKFWLALTNEERKKTISRSLKFLKDNGIVQHNVITWKSKDINSRLRTPDYYKLTKGGIACIKKLWGLPINIDKYSAKLPVHIILKELAINQMIANYKLKVQHLENITLNKKIKNSKTKEWFNLRVIFTIKKDANIVQFIVEPIRRNNSWKEEITTKLSILGNIFELNKGKIDDELVENPIIILLCEDVSHIEECFEMLHEANLVNENMFFTTDSLQVSTESNNILIKVEPDDEELNFIQYEIGCTGELEEGARTTVKSSKSK